MTFFSGKKFVSHKRYIVYVVVFDD
jgi:hypothetical protein